MQKKIFLFILAVILMSPSLVKADGIPEESRPVRRHRAAKQVKKVEEPVPAPICVPQSEHTKVKLVSFDPKQKVAKFLGTLRECSTTQWDVLKLLSGPNTIGLHYPEEHEKWGYLWLWSYDLKNPMEDTIILMDQAGKRIRKGKNPVELYLTFNRDDVLERIELALIKKRNSQYMISP